MSHVLVVDDSATDRKLAGRLLEKGVEVQVRYALNGRDALDQIRVERPDLVVSDLQMPEMNGLQLVEAVRKDYPSIPVILMTARGSEQIAAEALRRGAASYVPKASLANHLCATVERMLVAKQNDQLQSRLMHSLADDECHFVLRNDPELIEPLAQHVQELLRCLPLTDEAERLRVGLAIKHALLIAYYHGNLELPLSSNLDDEQFQKIVEDRGGKSPYCDRTIEFRMTVNREQAVFTIRHEGTEIQPQNLPEELQALAADSAWLSGFLVISAVMDDLSFDTARREILLLKKACAVEDGMELAVGEG
jgi:CheY-like chemotaxis protein